MFDSFRLRLRKARLKRVLAYERKFSNSISNAVGSDPVSFDFVRHTLQMIHADKTRAIMKVHESMKKIESLEGKRRINRLVKKGQILRPSGNGKVKVEKQR